MSHALAWTNPDLSFDRPLINIHQSHIHTGLGFLVIALAASAVLIFTSLLTTEMKIADETLILSVSYKKARAAAPPYALVDYKSVDVMKFTKDVMRNQQSDAQIENIVSAIALNLKPNYIAISIPLDSSADYPGQKPSPRTAAGFTQKWADTIHAHGMKIIWRGTWSGIEGIYDFPKKTGTNRVTAQTWLDKTSSYIIDNPTFFAADDIWAVMPERTEGIFQDSTSFLPHTTPGIQANYANFFNNLKTISDAAFARIGKNVITGWTANNFTEVKSGWLPNSVFTTAGVISIDHYGSTHTVAEMEADLRAIYNDKKKPIFLQEWGDYWNQNLNEAPRAQYLRDMFALFQKLSDEKILIGFNYWGGWDNNLEGILNKTGSNYGINSRGQILSQFYAANQRITTQPPPAPTPTPPATPPPVAVVPPTTPSPAPAPEPNPSPAPQPTPTPPPPTRNNYPTGTLVNDHGTIYFVNNSHKIPFTNFKAFVDLGYAKKPVVNGSLDDYDLPQTYRIENGLQSHPWGSWVIYNRTIYYIHQSGLIGSPTLEIFTANGGKFDHVVEANSSDIAIISNQILTLNDSRVAR